MAATISCQPCCTTTPPVQVPGVEGLSGSDGIDGQNAYTRTTDDFVVPAVGSNVTIFVENSDWMVIGQNVVADGPATFQVVSLGASTSAELKFLGYELDISPGDTVSSGARVGPAGTQPVITSNTYDSGQFAIGNGEPQVDTFTHGLGDIPLFVALLLVLKEGESDLGYTAGDRVDALTASTDDTPASPAFAVMRNTTEIKVIAGGEDEIRVVSLTDGEIHAIDKSKWNLQVLAIGP